jgi:hypothetical protein
MCSFTWFFCPRSSELVFIQALEVNILRYHEKPYQLVHRSWIPNRPSSPIHTSRSTKHQLIRSIPENILELSRARGISEHCYGRATRGLTVVPAGVTVCAVGRFHCSLGSRQAASYYHLNIIVNV